MGIYVVDTHALVWYFTGSRKLGETALEVFRESTNGLHLMIIPAIVLAEVIDIAEKKRVGISFNELLEKIDCSGNFDLMALDREVLKMVDKLKGLYELHDRIIVATAKLLECPLITKDSRITEAEVVEVIW